MALIDIAHAPEALKVWLHGRFFSATVGDSRHRNTTSATAGDPQRQKYVKLTSLVLSNYGAIWVFTCEDGQGPAIVGDLFKILNKSPGVARRSSVFLIGQKSADVTL